MRLPPALVPLRHRLFRILWGANIVVSLGVWMQNTGAGWLMTTLSPNPLTVSMVQAATIMPVFLLALPAGAIADIVDKRRFIVGTQVWMLAAAAALAGITYLGQTTAASLLLLTFAIGIGAAMNGPAWGSVMAEVVPRQDLAQAIALNGVGFNLARAIGPAIAGVLLLVGGPALTFGLNACSYLAVILVLLSWRRRTRPSKLPREQLLSAMRAGMRFARHTPIMRAAMLRAAAFFAPAAAPWGMLPLVVREQLGLGAGFYGLLLGLMGIGGVTAGLMLPDVRARLSRGNTVFLATLCSCAGMAVLAVSRHWLPSAVAMVVFGVGWVAASAVAQGAAQLAAPPWVRSRALAIYQLASNGALVAGTFFWGWLGTRVGLPMALGAAAAVGVVGAVLVRGFDIDSDRAAAPAPRPGAMAAEAIGPEAVAPELVPVVGATRARIMESQHFRIDPRQQDAFLAVMAEVRDVRSRAGAVVWQLYEDLAHPEGWVELWVVETWTDHLREAMRLSDDDRAVLGRAQAFHLGDPLGPSRYIAVAPHRLGLVGRGVNGGLVQCRAHCTLRLLSGVGRPGAAAWRPRARLGPADFAHARLDDAQAGRGRHGAVPTIAQPTQDRPRCAHSLSSAGHPASRPLRPAPCGWPGPPLPCWPRAWPSRCRRARRTGRPPAPSSFGWARRSNSASGAATGWIASRASRPTRSGSCRRRSSASCPSARACLTSRRTRSAPPAWARASWARP